jgi:Flp pilus assembly protein TadD
MSTDAYNDYQDGVRLLDESNPHAAVVPLERARELEPDKGSIRETLGRAYFRTGRFSAAGEEFAKALELDPVNDYAHFGLGLCLLRAGEAAAARGHLRLATVMRPEVDAYRDALATADDALVEYDAAREQRDAPSGDDA